MKIKITYYNSYLLLIMIVLSIGVNAQKINQEIKMKVIENEVIILNSPEKTWEALAAFGNVSRFHSTIEESVSLNGSLDLASLGAERECLIPNGVNNIILKERIIEFIDDSFYTYEVYEWENFPIRKMQVSFGVRMDDLGRTILYSRLEYKLSSVLMTRLLKNKLKRGNMDSLIAYKYYIETGEENTDIKVLRKRYQQRDHIKSGELLVVNMLFNKH